jgi:hypothetical protein
MNIPVWVSVLGWSADIGVLMFYATGHVRAYAWANLGLCVPVALPAILSGAYSTAALSFAFGGVGASILWRTRPSGAVSTRHPPSENV